MTNEKTGFRNPAQEVADAFERVQEDLSEEETNWLNVYAAFTAASADTKSRADNLTEELKATIQQVKDGHFEGINAVMGLLNVVAQSQAVFFVRSSEWSSGVGSLVAKVGMDVNELHLRVSRIERRIDELHLAKQR